MAKGAFNKKRALFTNTLDLKLRKKLVKNYIWSIALYGADKLDDSGSRSETPWKVLRCGAGGGWKDQLERSCEK
jgi:hypothetical protein